MTFAADVRSRRTFRQSLLKNWPAQNFIAALFSPTDILTAHRPSWSGDGARAADRLGAGTQLPALLIDDERAVAVAVALKTTTTSGVGIEEAAARAPATVWQVVPARLRHRIDATSSPPERGTIS